MYNSNYGDRDNYTPTSTINHGLKATKTTILILFLFSLSGFAMLPAQSSSWKDLGNFSWSIDSPTGYFDSGDTIVYTFNLGAAGDSARVIQGINLWLELASHVTIPTNCSPDCSGSWLFDDTNYEDSVYFDTGELSLLTERIDGVSRTGMGKVYTFRLISGANDVRAADLITDGGGMVLVDNVEMRLAPAPKVVKLEHAVLNAEGVPGGWESLALPDSGGAGLNLSPGLHFLRETMGDGEVRYRKVLVRRE